MLTAADSSDNSGTTAVAVVSSAAQPRSRHPAAGCVRDATALPWAASAGGGSRRQTAGSRWQAAGGRQQAAGGRRRAAGGGQQAADSGQEAADGRWLAGDHVRDRRLSRRCRTRLTAASSLDGGRGASDASGSCHASGHQQPDCDLTALLGAAPSWLAPASHHLRGLARSWPAAASRLVCPAWSW